MRVRVHQLPISALEAGVNVLKVYPSFLFNRVWSRPLSLNLILTTRCNSKCITCDSWLLSDHDNELVLDDFTRLAQQAHDLGVQVVTLGGGEPLLRSDLMDIIAAFGSAGLITQLTTNGLSLRGPQWQRLKQSQLNRITVSFDSHIPDIYEKIRGVDGADRVSNNLRNICSDRPNHLEIDTNTVLCADNAATFLETIDFLINLGVAKVNFSAVTTSQDNYLIKQAKSSLGNISWESILAIQSGLRVRKRRFGSVIAASSAFIDGLSSYFRSPHQQVYSCFAGFLTLDIFQNGDVHGCGNLPAFGNVRTQSLVEIWKGSAAQNNRMNMAQGKCPNCYLSCKVELAIAGNLVRLPRFVWDKLT